MNSSCSNVQLQIASRLVGEMDFAILFRIVSQIDPCPSCAIKTGSSLKKTVLRCSEIREEFSSFLIGKKGCTVLSDIILHIKDCNACKIKTGSFKNETPTQCFEIRQQFSAFLAGGEDDTDLLKMVYHIEHCFPCKMETDSIEEAWNKLGSFEVPDSMIPNMVPPSGDDIQQGGPPPVRSSSDLKLSYDHDNPDLHLGKHPKLSS